LLRDDGSWTPWNALLALLVIYQIIPPFAIAGIVLNH
jgi:hypothetical protein